MRPETGTVVRCGSLPVMRGRSALPTQPPRHESCVLRMPSGQRRRAIGCCPLDMIRRGTAADHSPRTTPRALPQEKLAAAQRAPVQPPPPPPAPTLKELEAELDLGAALHAASEAFRAMPAVATKLAPGFVRLTPGISPGETVLVTGADGPIGKLVVAELLARCPGSKVRACGGSLVALEENLAELVGAAGDGAEAVELVQWDAITDPLAVGFDGVSAVVWCASSFGRQAPAIKEKEAVDVTQRLSQVRTRSRLTVLCSSRPPPQPAGATVSRRLCMAPPAPLYLAHRTLLYV